LASTGGSLLAGAEGYSTLWSWARLGLPFAWAEGVPVWVAADAGTGRIARIVADPPGESLVVTVAEVDWAAEVNPAQLSAASPAVGPTRPPYFRTGLSPEDISGDCPPQADVSPPAWAPTVATPNCISQPGGDLVKLDLYEEIVPEVWDPAGAAVRIVEVQSNEPDAHTRPGDKPDDIRFNAKTVCLRADRPTTSPRVSTRSPSRRRTAIATPQTRT
jgi:hypothetical protein